VASGTIDALVRAYRERGRGIFLPVYGDRRGHPILVDTAYRSEIHGLDPEIGLRQLLQAHPEDVVAVEVDETEAPEDMDVPDDYVKAVAKRR
jgi:molybdenum cofactor cytidylyltransferase